MVRAEASGRGSAPSIDAGPYRAAFTRAHADVDRRAPCPYCGAACTPLDRVCPGCDVPLDRARCPKCLRLEITGRRRCSGCGGELALPRNEDARDAPCPRCDEPLRGVATQEGMFECGRCHGLFVEAARVALLLRHATLVDEPVVGARDGAPGARTHERGEVRYLKCPVCHTPMTRAAAKGRGVVVDVCSLHGTWFDANELDAVLGE